MIGLFIRTDKGIFPCEVEVTDKTKKLKAIKAEVEKAKNKCYKDKKKDDKADPYKVDKVKIKV